MKKKEREHLKEDPFKQFIENAVKILQQYQKAIYIGIGVVVGIVVIYSAASAFHFYSINAENRVYSQVFRVKNDQSLTIDQKIGKLNKLDSKGGVAASVKLFLAVLYFEKGDLNKSGEILAKFSSSNIKILNEEKTLLEADILCASNKRKEALDLLNKLLSDPKSETAKDFVLLKMAKIQIKTGQTDTAKVNLNKIVNEYPQSVYAYEAKTLLSDLENN